MRIGTLRPVAVMLLVTGIVSWSTSASAGLFEKLEEELSYWPDSIIFEETYDHTDGSSVWIESGSVGGPAVGDVIMVKPWYEKYLSAKLEPILLVRSLYVHTFADSYTETLDDGTALQLDSSLLAATQYGHLDGFSLGDVQLGFQGRFNDSGFYYKLLLDMVPRYKDGSSSGEYLADAYVGWSKYTVFDVKVGRMMLPFGKACQTPVGERLLIRAPAFDPFLPERQMGAMATVADPWQIVKVTGGLFDSSKLGATQMSTTDALLQVARAELDLAKLLATLGVDLWDLELTAGASYASVDEFHSPATEHRWIGIDGHLHLLLVTVDFEYLIKDYYAEAALDGSQTALRGTGWHVDGVIHAWPEVIDLVFRYEKADGDDVFDWWPTPTYIANELLVLQGKTWMTLGLRFHLSDQALLEVDYLVRDETEGPSFDNDVIMGMFQFSL